VPAAISLVAGSSFVFDTIAPTLRSSTVYRLLEYYICWIYIIDLNSQFSIEYEYIYMIEYNLIKINDIEYYY